MSLNTALWSAMAASFVVEHAVLTWNVGGVKNQDRTWWGDRLIIWLEYPQAIIAAMIAFHEGGMSDYFVGTVLVAVPLSLKLYREYRLSVVVINFQQKVLSEFADSLILLADRCMSVIAIAFVAMVVSRHTTAS